jgi:hypothetical protein
VDGQEQCVRISRSVTRGASRGAFAGYSRESFQLPSTMLIAENDVVSRPREDRSELAAHQPRTKNANAHVLSLALVTRPP